LGSRTFVGLIRDHRPRVGRIKAMGVSMHGREGEDKDLERG